MSGNGIRHFLDLIDIPANDLRGIITASRAMKTSGAAAVAQAARWQDHRHDL